MLLKSIAVKKGDIVAVVGSGGKTTMIFALAAELLKKEQSVLITTTTKMWSNIVKAEELLLVGNERQLKTCLKEKRKQNFSVLGKNILANKLIGIPAIWLEQHITLFRDNWDVILVEADGSKGKSLKAPNSKEPVIPQNATKVIVVIGVDIIGQQLTENNVHRAELVSQLTGMTMGATITVDTIAQMIMAKKGLLKGTTKTQQIYLVFNKYNSLSLSEKVKLTTTIKKVVDRPIEILVTELAQKQVKVLR